MPSIADVLLARYGSVPPSVPGSANDTIAIELLHRSIRAFLPQPLPPGTLELLVAAGQSAASSSHLQTWSVVAVEEPARKARLAVLAANQKQIPEAPLLLVFLADLSRLRRAGARAEHPTDGLDYLESLLVGVIDASLAAQNVALAAESLGLGIGYIGAMRNHPEDVASELGLPPGAFAVFGMCIGKPDPARPAEIKPRLPQRAVLHRERYDTVMEEESIDSFDRVMKAFYRSQNLPAEDWVSRMLERVKGPESLSHRDRMVEALHNLGFQLK